MSEDNNRSPEARRKRVQRLKKIIILVLIISILIPIVCCIILFGKVHSINQTLQSLNGQLEQLNGLLKEQSSATENGIDRTKQVTVDSGVTKDVLSNMQSGNQNALEITGVMERGEHAHQVYLTFDDGPSKYTDDILDILDRYGMKATFFVVGKEDEHSRDMMRRIVEEGHSIGMHSYSHKYSEIYQSQESFAEDFVKIQDYLYDITGVRSYLYRFPGGSSNTVSDTPMEQLISYLDSQNVTYYDWNIASGDAGSRLLGVQELVENSTKDITKRQNSIILLHDSADKRTTVEALPIIIESILELDDTVILPITEDTEPIQHKSN